MKRVLATLVLPLLFTPVMAEEQNQSSIQPTTAPSQEQKTDATTPKESTNIVDFCRTHTC